MWDLIGLRLKINQQMKKKVRKLEYILKLRTTYK